MRLTPALYICLLLPLAPAAHAQVTEIEVNDGTTATCYTVSGGTPCGFFTAPTIDTLVDDGAGNFSEINTTSTSTIVTTTSGGSSSNLVVSSTNTGLLSQDPSVGFAGAGTQVGTSTITGLPSGQFVAIGENTSGQDSGIQLEGTVGFIRTRDTNLDTVGFYQTNANGTVFGYATASTNTAISTITSTAAGHQILGNTALSGTFAASGVSTLSGIDNQGAGIANAGAVTGVTAGAVTATSTDAINGSQLFATDARVTAAQSTADTALTNAATAQATANGAQATADTALTNAATAQATASGAQTTADTALTNAATAQTTANTAQTSAATAQANSAAALNNANVAVTTANAAHTTATSAYNLASSMDGRLTTLESTVRGFDEDIQRVDRMAGRGIAIATALASMPDLDSGKRMGFGFGVGSYEGHNAFSAAFVVRASDNAKFRVNAGTAGDSRFAFGAGGMFSW